MNRQSKIHTSLTLFWVLMVIPTLLFWSDSVTVVLIYSIYALIASHWSAYEAANNAAVDDATRDKLDAIADGLADFMERYAKNLQDEESRERILQDVKDLRAAVGIEEIESS